MEVASAENGAGWLAFGRGLVARGLSGVQLMTFDAHPGLITAVGATLPGVAWQWCRTRDLSHTPPGTAEQPDQTQPPVR